MKSIVAIFLSLLLPFAATAQNSNNYLQVVSNTSLNWHISTESQVENDQTLYNALSFRVKNRSNPSPRSLYVRVSSFTTPSGFSTTDIPLQLDYVSDNSSHEINLVTTPFTLTTTNQRMFSHKKHSNNAVYTFNYNIINTATLWDYPPGTYNFTLTFQFKNP